MLYFLINVQLSHDLTGDTR